MHVILKKDDEPRIVEVPEDFSKQLKENQQARSFFDILSQTNLKLHDEIQEDFYSYFK